jgi:hypothetical protein
MTETQRKRKEKRKRRNYIGQYKDCWEGEEEVEGLKDT